MSTRGNGYTHPRAKGYCDWRPHMKTREVLSTVEAVLAEYREHWPLTLRQVFYRLVGNHGYEKTEAAYKRLQEYLVRARRARMIPWEALRDDGRTDRRPNRFTGKAAFREAVRDAAASYRRDKRQDQPWRAAVLVEAASMVPQAVRVAHPLDVPVFSSGGFDSLTVKHDLVDLAVDLAPVVFLHVGDLDPSGVCIFDAVRADVEAFLAVDAPSVRAGVRFHRVALTPEQVDAYNLPTAPAKETDARNNGVRETCQAEALPPDVLAALVREAILDYTDMPLFAAAERVEAQERAELVQAVGG
ncbi:MAG: hypothetical protein HY321_21135 [Armatimonadetes bacterium]|nr:hypothetical protein [Armatimonadota bacterium]